MGRPGPSRGFTLLELLVVMFIVGIIAAMATLSVGVATSEKGVEKEVQRLADLLDLARDEAVLQGREFGLTLYSRQYEFLVYDPAGPAWEPLQDESGVFSLRALPPDAVLELEVDGRIVRLLDEKPKPSRKEPDKKKAGPGLAGSRSGTRAKDDNQPQVFILSSGDVTPFAVHMRPSVGQAGIRLEVEENGAIREVRDDR